MNVSGHWDWTDPKFYVGCRAEGEAAGPTSGKVALFTTCYNNVNEPDVGMDLVAVFEHNGIPITIPRATNLSRDKL